MNYYRVEYTSKEEFLSDMVARGILEVNAEGEYIKTPKCEVMVDGISIVETPATFDEEGEVLTEAVISSGYHSDLLLNEVEDFGDKLRTPASPQHKIWN